MEDYGKFVKLVKQLIVQLIICCERQVILPNATLKILNNIEIEI